MVDVNRGVVQVWLMLYHAICEECIPVIEILDLSHVYSGFVAPAARHCIVNDNEAFFNCG